jgi:hypothetical protein
MFRRKGAEVAEWRAALFKKYLLAGMLLRLILRPSSYHFHPL